MVPGRLPEVSKGSKMASRGDPKGPKWPPRGVPETPRDTPRSAVGASNATHAIQSARAARIAPSPVTNSTTWRLRPLPYNTLYLYGKQYNWTQDFVLRVFYTHPHAGPRGVGGFDWPAATAADPGNKLEPEIEKRKPNGATKV